jgi:Protein of unknown function (DUF1501)
MTPNHSNLLLRRQFFASGSSVLGAAALANLMGPAVQAAPGSIEHVPIGPHFTPKAKRVIYLHMVGGPSQMDLFDYKPVMQDWYDKDLPDSVRQGQRLTTMTSGQSRFAIAPSKYKFAPAGACGMWMNTECRTWPRRLTKSVGCAACTLRQSIMNRQLPPCKLVIR